MHLFTWSQCSPSHHLHHHQTPKILHPPTTPDLHFLICTNPPHSSSPYQHRSHFFCILHSHACRPFFQCTLWFWMCWFPILLSLPSQSATLFHFNHHLCGAGGWETALNAVWTVSVAALRSDLYIVLPWFSVISKWLVLQIVLSWYKALLTCKLPWQTDTCTPSHSNSFLLTWQGDSFLANVSIFGFHSA